MMHDNILLNHFVVKKKIIINVHFANKDRLIISLQTSMKYLLLVKLSFINKHEIEKNPKKSKNKSINETKYKFKAE